MAWLENWWPDAKKPLRRMLWYNRSDEILKLLQASTQSNSIMISDDSTDIDKWRDCLHSLFYISTFITRTNWMVDKNYRSLEMCPIPEQMPAFFSGIMVIDNA
jgi:hypothetical protein